MTAGVRLSVCSWVFLALLLPLHVSAGLAPTDAGFFVSPNDDGARPNADLAVPFVVGTGPRSNIPLWFDPTLGGGGATFGVFAAVIQGFSPEPITVQLDCTNEFCNPDALPPDAFEVWAGDPIEGEFAPFRVGYLDIVPTGFAPWFLQVTGGSVMDFGDFLVHDLKHHVIVETPEPAGLWAWAIGAVLARRARWAIMRET